MSLKSKIGFLFRFSGKSVSVVRTIFLNLFFVVSMVLLYLTISQFQPTKVPEQGVLLINPTGKIVEQYSFNDPLLKLLNPESVAPETSRFDIVHALQLAAKDDRIKAVVIDPDKITGIGRSAINSIQRAIGQVNDAGKPVYAYSRGMYQHQYLLASSADEIHLHPMGGVVITGYGVFRDYMKSALDKLNIDMHVFRVGAFKSAMEPFMRNGMSAAAERANAQWLNGLWGSYTKEVALKRDLAPESIVEYSHRYAKLLASFKGNSAQLALQRGLVDHISTSTTFWRGLEDELSSINDIDKAVIGLQDYLVANFEFKPVASESSVAVVTLEGAIVDGESPPGSAGGDSIAALLASARKDDKIKSVVLRVNSGGGSAFASEIIREQMVLLQEAGKPVVVSMSEVAASGGYWVAANADEIWASPTTITGSIGIFAAIPTLDRAAKKLGITNDGIGTGPLAEGYNPLRPLNPALASAVQSSIEHGYEQFISLVATGRNISQEQTLAAAGGRVWTGEDAKQRGLVDYMGEIEDAISSAAKLAGISGEPDVIYYQDPRWAQLSLLQRFITVAMPAEAISGTAALNTTLNALIKQWLPIWLLAPDRNNVYLRCVECSVLE